MNFEIVHFLYFHDGGKRTTHYGWCSTSEEAQDMVDELNNGDSPPTYEWYDRGD